ncbi:MAG: hypothetical protein ACOYXC_03830, partial [Candidatus Rifleibacteriota bacterium]
MRKVTAGLLLALAVCCPSLVPVSPVCLAQAAEAEINEEANILYQEALALKKQGNVEKAVDAYHRAMRKDRGILAFDDEGLIEALKKDCEQKLEKDPNDVKTIETLAFVNAVCYSDYQAAIKNYEKVVELVTDQAVKEKTVALIERLKATAEAQQQYQTEVAQEIREERLKSWSEMERIERYGEEAAEAQEKARALAEKYKEKDSLKNRVPQLEQELSDMREDLEKAKRMWYSLKDDLYDRRRRRLEDEIEVKEKELSEAREELEGVEEETAQLEREVQFKKQQEQQSAIKTYDNYQNPNAQNPENQGSENNGQSEPPADDRPS